MKKLHTLFILFCFSSSIFCQMSINDPQSWMSGGPASLENIEIEVQTIGIYTKTSIAFDIESSDPYYFSDNDLLEFVFDFEMSEKTIFNDSWLWIGDYISEGEVYEQGKGTQIYESIVDRQQDPSILTQLSSTEYNLKVYPLKWDSTRRVRLSYLEALNYQGRNAVFSLPLGLLKHSNQEPENINVIIHNSEKYEFEDLQGNEWVLEEESNNSKVYKYLFQDNPNTFVDMPLKVTSLNQDVDIQLETYKGEEDNYYQLIYYPETESEHKGKNYMILLDYDEHTTDISYDQVIETLRDALLQLKEEDHFIICYSDFSTLFSSDDWTSATSENIAEVILKVEEISPFFDSKLPILLPEALTRLEELNQEAELLILSSNIEFVEEYEANEFLDEIDYFYSGMNTKVSISVIDCATNKPWTYIGEESFYGNEYFYKKLTSQTSGQYFENVFSYDIYESLVVLFSASESFTDQYEFQVSINDGFTYGNFIEVSDQYLLGDTKPIVAVGKYVGDEPFKVKFKYHNGTEVLTDVKEVDPASSNPLDEMAVTIWNANLIQAMQHSDNNDDKRQVIETSIYERLLSMHTVFLCLEPDFDSISSNNNNEDEEIFVLNTEEEKERETTVNIYPNPFISELNIEFPIENVFKVDYVVIRILDSKGQLIERLIKTNGFVEGLNSIQWKPKSDLNDEVYIIQIQIDDKMYNQKVVHLRF